MEVPFPPESTSIHPLNLLRRSFLGLDVLRLCCCAPAFHGLPVAVDEGDKVRLPAWARLVGPPPAWVRPVGAPAAWARPIEASPTWVPPGWTPTGLFPSFSGVALGAVVLGAADLGASVQCISCGHNDS
jgi:hypothetical protein